MKLTKNFALSEFKCNDKKGTPVPYKYYGNVMYLAMQLQIIRDHINSERVKANLPEIQLDLISAFRTLLYNLRVRGKKGSMHKFAGAGDLKARIIGTKDYLKPAQLHVSILYLIRHKKISEGGVGIYNTFVHYDIRGYAARWDMRS